MQFIPPFINGCDRKCIGILFIRADSKWNRTFSSNNTFSYVLTNYMYSLRFVWSSFPHNLNIEANASSSNEMMNGIVIHEKRLRLGNHFNTGKSRKLRLYTTVQDYRVHSCIQNTFEFSKWRRKMLAVALLHFYFDNVNYQFGDWWTYCFFLIYLSKLIGKLVQEVNFVRKRPLDDLLFLSAHYGES